MIFWYPVNYYKYSHTLEKWAMRKCLLQLLHSWVRLNGKKTKTTLYWIFMWTRSGYWMNPLNQRMLQHPLFNCLKDVNKTKVTLKKHLKTPLFFFNANNLQNEINTLSTQKRFMRSLKKKWSNKINNTRHLLCFYIHMHYFLFQKWLPTSELVQVLWNLLVLKYSSYSSLAAMLQKMQAGKEGMTALLLKLAFQSQPRSHLSFLVPYPKNRQPG